MLFSTLTGSVPSLVAGVAFGSLLAYGAYRVSRNPNDITLSLGKNCCVNTYDGLKRTEAMKELLRVTMSILHVNSNKFGPRGLHGLPILAVGENYAGRRNDFNEVCSAL